jgi:hypothetical protein
VLNWLIAKGENLASDLWREAVLAIRFVKKSITEVMNWAAAQAENVFNQIVKVLDEIGESVKSLIEWAEAAGSWALEKIGKAIVDVKKSVDYVLNYLEKDFIPGLEKVVKGILDAGYAVAELVVWMAKKSATIVAEIVKGAFAAGVTLATLIAETIKHPENAYQNLLNAYASLGKTLKDLFQVVIIDTANQFLDETIKALVKIGKAAMEILMGVLEIAGGAIGAAIDILFQLLVGYRPLSETEKIEARKVFGNSINLEEVSISEDDAQNDIIFGVQDFFNQLFAGNFSHLTDNIDSRAFVTGNLINFDKDDPFGFDKLIHELTHVWQNQHVGPVYLAHAVESQMLGAGYNYGYTNVKNGDGGETELQASGGNLGNFNPEQQGQIAMHYYVRRYQDNLPYTDWEPYIVSLKAGMPERNVA